LQAQFAAQGVSCDYVDAHTNRLEREAVRSRFHRGETRVVCNVGVLTTGIDWDVRCIVLARPTKSEMLFVQMIGRGLRTANGKDHCKILDHSDTHLRLGFVTDIHHAELHHGRERVASAPPLPALPKACPQCAFLKPPRTALCPNCGFTTQAVNGVKHADGELAELARKRRPASAVTASMFEKEEFYRGLLFIGNERGYKRGWADNQYRQKYGVWPNAFKGAAPRPPSLATRSWVKSRQIAYAKARAKQGAAAHAPAIR
jgi:hypothetical protein